MLYYNTTGYYNTALGYNAGYNQTAGINNIYLGYNVQGNAGESNITRIGNGQTDAYIAGILHGDGSGLTNVTASSVTGTVAIANGGTGSNSKNFVDLTTAQTVNGAKTFSSTISGNISGNAANVTGIVAEPNIDPLIARDAEVTSAIGVHAANASAHHTRYTDAEAVAAIKTSDGPGSGLDADLLDGINAGQFARADTSNTFNQPQMFPAGTAAAPSITFSGDANTGIFSPGADRVSITGGGTTAMDIYGNGDTVIWNRIFLGGDSTSRLIMFDAANDTFILNNDLAVSGNVKVSGTGNGVVFPDGTVQTTAAAPTWSQILPAAQRFVLVMGNEAVLDKETGLVWEKSTDATTRIWNAALSYCYGLNLGGRGGWRLPTVEELRTLVDPTQSNPALPGGHPFTNMRSDIFWSSTTYESNTGYARNVFFNDGLVGYHDKGNSFYVRCVRGGQ